MSRAELAAQAVLPRPVGPFHHEATPSIQSILRAFEADGGGDREMLLALLHCKRAEDERLAALDNCRAEELATLRLATSHPGPHVTQGQLMSPPLSTHDDACPPISSRSSSMSSAASSGGPLSPPPVHVEAYGSGAGGKKRKRQATDEASRPLGPTPPHDVVMSMLRAKVSRTDSSFAAAPSPPPRRSPVVPAVSPKTVAAPFPPPSASAAAVQAAHGLASLVHSASTQLPPSRFRPQVSSVRDEL